MIPEESKLLTDMLQHARRIQVQLKQANLLSVDPDDPRHDAAYFNFVIIGEALKNLRAMNEQLADRISDCSKIIGFRNQIVHGYGKLDHAITDRIITEKLPTLLRELERLLGE